MSCSRCGESGNGKDGDALHCATIALRAAERIDPSELVAAFPVVASRFRDWREHRQQFAAAGQMLGTVTIAEKAVGADALKRIRKNMQQETP